MTSKNIWGRLLMTPTVYEDDFSIVYSAIWKDGPLRYDTYDTNRGWFRKSDMKVALKNLRDTSHDINEFLKKV